MKHISLALSLPRATVLESEWFLAFVEIVNDTDAPVRVPAPYDPGHGQFRYELRAAGSPVAVDLAAKVRPGGRLRRPVEQIELVPGQQYRTDVPVGRWGALEPGHYTLVACWSRGADEITSEVMPLVVLPVTLRSLALPVAALVAAPGFLSTTLLEAGDGLARVVTRRFGPHLEEEGALVHDGDVERLLPGHAPTAVVPVLAIDGPDAEAIVWTDELGLCAQARPGLAAATLPLAPASHHAVVRPALATAEHDVRVYVIRTDGAAAQLLECRFARPTTIVVPPDPDIPDDWDDEDEVPGPTSLLPIGALARPALGSGALALTPDRDGRRLVYLASTAAGLSIEHIVVHAGQITGTSAAELPGAAALPGSEPVVYVDAQGQTVVAVLVGRWQAAKPGPRLEVLLVTARFAAGARTRLDTRRVAWLAAPPRSTALALSWVAAERPFCRAALLLADGTLHEGDARAALRPAACEGAPLVPLVLGTTRDRGYLAVESPRGPLLTTLVSRA